MKIFYPSYKQTFEVNNLLEMHKYVISKSEKRNGILLAQWKAGKEFVAQDIQNQGFLIEKKYTTGKFHIWHSFRPAIRATYELPRYNKVTFSIETKPSIVYLILGFTFLASLSVFFEGFNSYTMLLSAGSFLGLNLMCYIWGSLLYYAEYNAARKVIEGLLSIAKVQKKNS